MYNFITHFTGLVFTHPCWEYSRAINHCLQLWLYFHYIWSIYVVLIFILIRIASGPMYKASKREVGIICTQLPAGRIHCNDSSKLIDVLRGKLSNTQYIMEMHIVWVNVVLFHHLPSVCLCFVYTRRLFNRQYTATTIHMRAGCPFLFSICI